MLTALLVSLRFSGSKFYSVHCVSYAIMYSSGIQTELYAHITAVIFMMIGLAVVGSLFCSTYGGIRIWTKRFFDRRIGFSDMEYVLAHNMLQYAN